MASMTSDSNLALVEILCAFLGITSCLLIKIDSTQSKPYMDEIFHISQAQKYCNGSFGEWDPMLTTPPGLYVLSIGVLKPLGWLLGLPYTEICSTFRLRSVNVIFAVLNVYLLVLLTRKIHAKTKGYADIRALFNAATLATFPPLYFFTFLYYTDSGSTFLVLLAYIFSLHRCDKLSAFVGALSITLRQTNVTWVMFVAGLRLSETITSLLRTDKKFDGDVSSARVIPTIYTFVKNAKKSALLVELLRCTWPYICVGVMFAGFIVYNGSIVLGAHTDHQAVLHFPQLYYFASFTTAFAFSHLISYRKIVNFMRFLHKRLLIVLLFTVVSVVLVYKFTYAHRYLLADNRHYTFYIWSKIYQRHALVKYALIPGYLFAMWSMLAALHSKDLLWKSAFVMCIVLNLLPAMLLEFRYFVIAYLIFRLNIALPSYMKLCAEFIVYVCVNIVTLYLFMGKPFQWAGQAETQRFMW